MNYAGVDPGSTGAISIITFDGVPTLPKVQIFKMPESIEGIHNIIKDFFNINTWVCCEAVHSSPQMGVSTAFKFGRNFGLLEGLLAGKNVDYVSPQKWQAALNCRTAGNKAVSLVKAKELFPEVKGITLKTADSLLIAYYCWMKYGK